MARWSCSKTLLRYGTGRCWQPESSSFTLELSDRGRVTGVLVGVDSSRRGMVLLTQGFGQEALCCDRGSDRPTTVGELTRPTSVFIPGCRLQRCDDRLPSVG